ncbi:DUF4260 family protein [Varunaivibrio sulfuroxidans]|uniref:Uncharacterized protein DUF4260 n=1 Tax=Varunaivibrio sulfuroxidans TaxID=1773489 RepID=A0A4R3J7E7_9PROT|nr:DUF4260 family protein [Varunaivibrio sulfuroxidans]TCS61332.1 uncharacterized protein DUF4260 [Varunaivibrio sulfuroxidans]WES31055.1 DUF4260 family protein [Varunaivibrio sulfuroxidans]
MNITLALRLDALAILAASVGLHAYFGGNWWGFALFLALPDLAIIPYALFAKSSPWPRWIYNAAHTYALPVALSLIFWSSGPYFLFGWVAHIALDRVLGFGMKSSQGFKVTHLQMLGE